MTHTDLLPTPLDPLPDPADLERMDLGAGPARRCGPIADDEGPRRDAEGAQAPDEVATRRVPREQDRDSARERRGALEDRVAKRAERLVAAGAHPSQDLEHVVRVAEAAPRGKAIGLGPHEQEVEERVLGLDRAGDRRRDGDRLLEDVALLVLREPVPDERVADEELVLVLLHHRPADARCAPPVNAAQRVAGAVIAQ